MMFGRLTQRAAASTPCANGAANAAEAAAVCSTVRRVSNVLLILHPPSSVKLDRILTSPSLLQEQRAVPTVACGILALIGEVEVAIAEARNEIKRAQARAFDPTRTDNDGALARRRMAMRMDGGHAVQMPVSDMLGNAWHIMQTVYPKPTQAPHTMRATTLINRSTMPG
jgi:hypothetical protein